MTVNPLKLSRFSHPVLNDSNILKTNAPSDVKNCIFEFLSAEDIFKACIKVSRVWNDVITKKCHPSDMLEFVLRKNCKNPRDYIIEKMQKQKRFDPSRELGLSHKGWLSYEYMRKIESQQAWFCSVESVRLSEFGAFVNAGHRNYAFHYIITGCSKLKELSFARHRDVGDVLKFLAGYHLNKLRFVTSLDLTHCPLDEEVMKAVAKCENLKELILTGIYIASDLEAYSFFQERHPDKMDISMLKFLGRNHPEIFRNLRRLSFNSFESTIVDIEMIYSKCKELRELDFGDYETFNAASIRYGCLMSDSSSFFQKLESLTLENIPLEESDIMKLFRQCESLKKLDFVNNEDVAKALFENPLFLPKLRSLVINVSKCSSEEIRRIFSNCPNLEELGLFVTKDSRLDQTHLVTQVLQNLKKLKKLMLDGEGDYDFEQIARLVTECESLQWLYSGIEEIQNKLQSSSECVKKLRTLEFPTSQSIESIKTMITSCKRLRSLFCWSDNAVFALTQIAEEGGDCLKELHTLHFGELSSSHPIGMICERCGNLRQVSFRRIPNIEEGLLNLRHPGLQSLDLRDCNLIGHEMWKNFLLNNNLKSLDLRQNPHMKYKLLELARSHVECFQGLRILSVDPEAKSAIDKYLSHIKSLR